MKNDSNIVLEKNVLRDVFSLFLGNDHMRPVMLNPFEKKGKTYATDGYSLVCCNSDKINFEYINNEKPLNVENVVPLVNLSESIDLDKIDWDSYKTEDETEDSGEDIECGHCKGQGNIDDRTYYKGKFYDFEYECPVCDGSGYEEECFQKPNGRKTFPTYTYVKVKDIYFYASKFFKLKKVKELMNEKIELIAYHGVNKGVLFKCGFLEILIMPVMKNEYDEGPVIEIN